MIAPAERRRVVDLALERVPPKEIARRLNLIPEDVYAAIKAARTQGVDIPTFQGTKKAEARAEVQNLRAELDAQHDALDLALPLMRTDLMVALESDSIFDEVEGDPVRRPGSSEPETVGLARSYIEAINAAEALVGRCIDDLPQWLDDLLDGRMKL